MRAIEATESGVGTFATTPNTCHRALVRPRSATIRSPAAINAPFRRKTLMKSGVSGAATSLLLRHGFSFLTPPRLSLSLQYGNILSMSQVGISSIRHPCFARKPQLERHTMPALRTERPRSLETARRHCCFGPATGNPVCCIPSRCAPRATSLQTHSDVTLGKHVHADSGSMLRHCLTAPHPVSRYFRRPTKPRCRPRQRISSRCNHTIGGAYLRFAAFDKGERLFLLDLVGPTAFIAPAFESGIDTLARPLKVGYPFRRCQLHPETIPAHGDLPEWGEGAQGYAKRYADRFGQGLVGTTSRYTLGEIMREDVSYHRCQCTGLLPRTAHAFLGAYTAHTHTWSRRSVDTCGRFAIHRLRSCRGCLVPGPL